jgi:predicted GNAT superfamily acetyltransferase
LTEGLRIRRAEALADYRRCLELQKEAWGFTDPADYASIPLMRVQNTYGGSLLLGEDETGIVAFAYALLGRKPDGAAFWWSHMTAVSRSHQDRGIGLQIKMAQRNEALRHGIGEIDWTFDPLQARNAHFNLRRLGTVATAYLEDFYGISSSQLHFQIPTDRLRVEWRLEGRRAKERAEGVNPLILRDFDGIVRILDGSRSDPGTPNLDHRETPILVGVPARYPDSREGSRSAAGAWQRALRETFTHYLGAGYLITDFIRAKEDPPGAYYVLERASDA